MRVPDPLTFKLTEVSAFEVTSEDGHERYGYVIYHPKASKHSRWIAFGTLMTPEQTGDLLGVFANSHDACKAIMEHEQKLGR